ncbi:hypothetical protein NQ315_016728 [Exocentrus adspersus]|uniref:DDE-1 domain-containing protein n=1 Tax=Exocentrus adspersus TaxID=1586481 RepID=A0AAV8VFK8_9CUCU|nr:hypothetical protein NQ315_016728 [Exocentrus adspersus]
MASKGERNVYEVDHGDSKQNLTVMFTFSAVEDITPPMIVFLNKRLNSNVARSIPEEWGIGLSDTGWMKAEIFVEYIEKILYPYLKRKNVSFPIILFLDGHKTHLTYEVNEFYRKLDIILIALYPNSTRIPADVSIFRPLKITWRRAVLNWRRTNPFTKLSKEHFAPILQEALKSLSPAAIYTGQAVLDEIFKIRLLQHPSVPSPLFKIMGLCSFPLGG